jgi:hypothetical protein
MKKEHLSIYNLVWTMREIARELDCEHNGCVVGDLMIDAIRFSKMEDGDYSLWHIEKTCTWITKNEDMFDSNLYVVSKNNWYYSIEKIK